MPAKIAIVVGTQGRGSNMAALLDAIAARPHLATVLAVVSPKDATPAVERARAAGVPVRFAPAPADLLPAFSDADVVCLAGYAKLVPPEAVRAFSGRMLNVHPALLPKFGGQGMWGHKVHEAVIAAGEAESGCTVHLVDEEYDRGRTLLQLRCPVSPSDTPDDLAALVLKLEHEAYPRALFALLAEREAENGGGEAR